MIRKEMSRNEDVREKGNKKYFKRLRLKGAINNNHNGRTEAKSLKR